MSDLLFNGQSAAKTQFAIKRFMVSDAGAGTFNSLREKGHVENTKDWFFYATSADAMANGHAFDKANVCYLGDSPAAYTGGCDGNVDLGGQLTDYAIEKHNLKALLEAGKEKYKGTHFCGIFGGGSTPYFLAKASKLLAQSWKGQTGSFGTGVDFDALFKSLNTHGVLATIGIPQSTLTREVNNCKKSIKYLIEDEGGTYNPSISYQLIKIDDLIRSTGRTSLNKEEIIALFATHYEATNLILQKFNDLKSTIGTSIDLSEVLSSLAVNGEAVIGSGAANVASGTMMDAWNNFTASTKAKNNEATIGGAIKGRIMFEYPKNADLKSQSVLDAQTLVLETAQKATNLGSQYCDIKDCIVVSNVQYPTINCVFTGIAAETHRGSNAVETTGIMLDGFSRDLKASQDLLRGQSTTGLNKSESKSLHYAEQRIIEGRSQLGDEAKVEALAAKKGN